MLQLRPNFYMIAGAGGNIAVQVGDDGLVVVDAGTPEMASGVVDVIKRITSAPIRYVINTSADADHVGGNETVARAGKTPLQPRSLGLSTSFLGSGAASILATEHALTVLSSRNVSLLICKQTNRSRPSASYERTLREIPSCRWSHPLLP